MSRRGHTVRRLAVSILVLATLTVVAEPATASTFVGSTISTNTTWTVAGSPYLIASTGTRINTGVMLSINPGVIVKVANGGDLVVNGTLVTSGTATQPIVVTSVLDDSAGGDTNGDGNATIASPQKWVYIRITSTGSANLNYTTVRYAGRYNLYNVYVDGGSATINNSVLSWSYYGVGVSTGTLTLTNTAVSDNLSAGVRIAGSNAFATINGSTITRNTVGVHLNSGGFSIGSRTMIVENSDNGVSSLNSTIASSINDSDVAHNGHYGIFVSAGLVAGTEPHGSRNNIYENETLPDLYAAGDWNGNYFGSNTYWYYNDLRCLAHSQPVRHLAFSDDFLPPPLGPSGPVWYKVTQYEDEPNAIYYCFSDYPDIDETLFSYIE